VQRDVGYFCASPEEFASIHKQDKYPKFHVMVTQIDDALNAEGVFLAHSQTFPTLSSYTHSGMHQIGRRFDASRDLTPNYSIVEIAEVEYACAAMVASIAFAFFKKTGRPETATEFGRFYNSIYLPAST
jgi:hypothetical protein